MTAADSAGAEEIIEVDDSPIAVRDEVWWSYGIQGLLTGTVVSFADARLQIAVVKRGREHYQIPVAALQKLKLQR